MSKIDWPRRAGLSHALDEAAIVAITDRQGVILYCNKKFEAVSGYGRDELIGQTHGLLNSGHHPRSFFAEMYRTIGQGQVWRGTIQNRNKSGQPYWVDTTIIPNLGPDGAVETYEEGGRHTPFFTNYRPQFYFRTTDVTGIVHLKKGVEMIMPGDNAELTVELITPIAMDQGLRFAIREGGRTVGAGVVSKIIE